MKKLVIVGMGFIAVVIFMVTIFVGENKEKSEASAYLRVHIRANSNNSVDQDVKYKVKEAVVDYLTPKITQGSSFGEAYSIINKNKTQGSLF